MTAPRLTLALGRLLRRVGGVLALSLIVAAPSAHAAFGLHDLDVTFTNADGSPAMQAGSHPFQFNTELALNTVDENGGTYIDGALRDLIVTQAAGLVADRAAADTCSTKDFLTRIGGRDATCPNSSALGLTRVRLGNSGLDSLAGPFPVYSLAPPPGAIVKLGFWVGGVPQTVVVGLGKEHPYRGVASLRNVPQIIEVLDSEFTLWGNPADPAHHPFRASCLRAAILESEQPPSLSHHHLLAFQATVSTGSCSAGPQRPFLTLPRSCKGPLATTFFARGWWQGDPLNPSPTATYTETIGTHDDSIPPQPLGTTGCAKLGFAPRIAAQPTSRAATAATGLDFSLRIDDEGLTNPAGNAGADIRKTVVTLPEGMTINPSQAEGLEVCTEAQLAKESAQSIPGEGCPDASKVGTVEVETPLLENKLLKGSLYVAKPFENLAENSLIAVYLVIKDAEVGISIKLPLKVEPDPRTGQLITTADNLPELPFSEFRLHFREGGRSPLISPRFCGTHTVEAVLHPSSGAPPRTETSSFQIISGPNGGPCPAPGTPPFEPGFSGGTLNNAAGEFSPFLLRLTRRDGDQDLVRFDATLPPGALAKLAGVEKCSDAAIAQIKAKTGLQERANPSCPPSSRIGTVQAGAGVGSQLTYVPGSVYLAGPFGGAPLSVVGVVPAVAGPFDVGVVSTRQALTLDPITGVAKVDGTLSEKIPHILAGIPLAVRDIRVSVDRPNFTLNPTNCEPLSFGAEIWGGGADPLSLLDDSPVARAARFQAADCASLGFKPRLGIQLRGGTKRGAHPALRAVVTPRPADANFSRAVVKLPTSAFLDQGHIRTICTRVQFAAGAGHGSLCPKGARYGFARAWSPLLEEPLVGPVFLRSSDNNLPDLVVALKGLVDIELSARIDSVKGGIRGTFTGIPDAPVSRFILDMQGGKKGLIVNSRNLCHKPGRNRAKSNIRGQNGKFSRTRPVVRAVKCKKNKRRKAKRSSHSRTRKASLARGSAAPPMR